MSTMKLTWIVVTIVYAFIAQPARALYFPMTSLYGGTELYAEKQLAALIESTLRNKTLDTRQTRGYVWQDFYDLYQFGNAPTVNGVNQRSAHENMVHSCIIHCMAILLESRAVLDEQLARRVVDHPSLIRYGPMNVMGANWIGIARNMVQRYLDVLGYNSDGPTRARCLPSIPKLQFWYGDPPSSVTIIPPGQGCANPASVAYFFVANVGQRNGIAFCPRFFSNYVNVDRLDASRFGPSLEMADVHPSRGPTYSTARVLLHELMHYADVYAPDRLFRSPLQGNGGIPDIHVRDPQGRTWTAYGAYMATKAKDPSWTWVLLPDFRVVPAGALRNSLFNADNWVCLFMEIYLKKKYNLPNDWQDPPDIRALYQPVPTGQPPPLAQSAPVRVAKSADVVQTSSVVGAWQFDPTNTLDNQVMVTELPTGIDSVFGTPTYAPDCSLCNA